jgi:hypothetical protein
VSSLTPIWPIPRNWLVLLMMLVLLEWLSLILWQWLLLLLEIGNHITQPILEPQMNIQQALRCNTNTVGTYQQHNRGDEMNDWQNQLTLSSKEVGKMTLFMISMRLRRQTRSLKVLYIYLSSISSFILSKGEIFVFWPDCHVVEFCYWLFVPNLIR